MGTRMMEVLDNNKQTVFKGEVIHGRQIGRTIGFPTANLRVSSEEEPYFQKVYTGSKSIIRMFRIMGS